MRAKKGSLDQLASLAATIAALAIALVVAFLIISQGKAQIGNVEGLSVDPSTGVLNATECMKSLACNGTSSLQVAMDIVPTWVPIIIIAFIGSILLGLVALFRRK